MVADIDTFDSILCCIVFILSYILQNGDDSVDRKLENETMAAFTLLQQIVSSYFELFWYSIRNFRTINFKQI
ncbi:hypothetical protein ES319_A01G156900v1 [Gossypium barbadense]|uniref:Uncharacterized protein n=2 Tax=Gossypium TaxID=3633 RepID=A0A5J5X0N6_GOSBA|nr:hypothetical protein ES319_A01G156900v1 [Gossypium barbadense]TYI43536.1 hypothetical protein ES332_A01G176800v1 [Gossypium tomentosum]